MGIKDPFDPVMPVHKTKGGYKYGKSGKTYKRRSDANKQARAIHAAKRKRAK